MKFKRTKGEVAFDVINVLVLLVITIACLYPFYYMLIYALSSPDQLFKGITFFPRGITLENFARTLSDTSLAHGLLVSVLRTVVGSVLTIVCCSFFAYLCSKKDMYGRKFIYRFVVSTMYLTAGLIPTYLVYRAYGLRNTFAVYILPTVIVPYYVVLLKTFFEQLPPALEESALLDGANTFQVWFKVVMPLSKPIVATIATFAMVAQWNAWFDTNIYISNDKLYTLQYILYTYLQEAQALANMANSTVDVIDLANTITPQTVRMTITAIVTIPVLCVYPFMQRYFVKGIMIGAVKG